MALEKSDLKNAIISAIGEIQVLNAQNGTTPEQCIELFATKLSDAIDSFVKTGEIKIAASSISVETSGSQTGANTSEITDSGLDTIEARAITVETEGNQTGSNTEELTFSIQ